MVLDPDPARPENHVACIPACKICHQNVEQLKKKLGEN